jgi:hypothetical protein
MRMFTNHADSQRFGVVLTALLVTACAPTTTQLAASGESRPATAREMSGADGQRTLLEAAFRPCADWPEVNGTVATTAELTLDGVSSGGRVSSRLWLALDLTSGAIRFEPVQPWPPAFVYIGTGLYERHGDEPDVDVDSTLILPRGGDPVRHVRSRDLLSSLLGVPLSAPELIAVITGCQPSRGSLGGYTLGPGRVRVIFEDALPADLWAVRDASERSGWALLAMGRAIPGRTLQWRADYTGRVLTPFRHFRIRSQNWNGVMNRDFDVSFSWSNIRLGVALDTNVFSAESLAPRPPS